MARLAGRLHRRAGAGQTRQLRAHHAVLRLRPHRRQPARRQPGAAAGAAPVSTAGPSSHRRWPAAPPAPSATPAARRQERQLLTKEVLDHNIAKVKEQLRRLLDFDTASQPRPPAGQRHLDRARQLPRFPARHRQAFFRQPDGGQGKRARPHGRPRGRHQLHRVQLHAAPGLRFLRAVPRLQLRAADRRQRSVGQHHRRHRSHPQEARAHGLWPHPAAHHQRRRHQVRQDRGRRRLARSGADQRLSASTSSGSAPTTATWSAT